MDRLIATDDGWWVMRAGAVAHVPPGAVLEGALTDEAEAALAQAGMLRDSQDPVPFSLTVLTATSCNLGCAYCFQNVNAAAVGGGNDAAAAGGPNARALNPFAPRRIARHLLDEQTTDDLVRFVSARMRATGYTTLHLLLFGGEPLLNVRGTLRLLDSLTGLGLVSADIVTNAVLLTPGLARDLAGGGVRNVQVTFDGHRAEHDRTRVDHRGRGTYDRILRNVQQAADASAELRWQFRVNVSRSNIDALDDLVDDLAALRLPAPAEIYLALVDDVGIGFGDTVDYSDRLAARFKELLGRAIDSGLATPPFANAADGCAFCGVVGGATGAVVSADGGLYSCWETAGKPEWRVGDIVEGYDNPDVLKRRWVASDYDVEAHGTALSTAAFYEDVNAFILERTYRPGRLDGVL